jgi:hypothetical protein
MSTDFTARLDEVLTELVTPTAQAETTEEAIDEQSYETELDDEDTVEVSDADSDSDESDDDAETSDDDEANADVIDLDLDAVVRIDGREVKVSEALELKATFTKKTQALSEERKAFEEEMAAVQGRLDYVEQLEQIWQDNPAQVIVGFVTGSDDVDAEDLFADAVVELAESGSADANLLAVKVLIKLAANDLMEDELAQMIGFTDEVINRLKSQVKTEERVTKVERRLAAEERKQAKVDESYAYEAEVQQHVDALNQQWDRVVKTNPEVASLSELELLDLKQQILEYAAENDGVPLHVAYDALEAQRLRGKSAQRAAEAASRKKKAQGSRVVSRPSASGPSPSPRKKGDWDAAIAEAVAELESRRKAK